MFSGSLVALITPYKSNLEVDFDALRNLVRFQVASGSSGIVVLGTTGEHLLLSEEEKSKIIQTVVKEVSGNIPVIANVGVASTWQSLQNAMVAKNLGVDALLVVTPYYVKPNEDGVITHLKEVAKSHLPILFYYHPGRTGVTLSVECVQNILQIPNVIAIKDATNNLKWINLLSGGYFAGDDSAAKDVMLAGGSGVISVVANLFPKEWAKAVSRVEGFESFSPLLEALSLETNPQCIKYAMFRAGLCHSCLRLPLMEPSTLTKEAIDFAMSNSFTGSSLSSSAE